jgi:hypothetical protein
VRPIVGDRRRDREAGLIVPLKLFVIGAISAIGALVGVRDVDLYIRAKEYYGGGCEVRFFELRLNATWYESDPVRCEPSWKAHMYEAD